MGTHDPYPGIDVVMDEIEALVRILLAAAAGTAIAMKCYEPRGVMLAYRHAT